MRTVCVAVTQLPSPTLQCRERQPSHEVHNPFYYCNDTIFSGHTCANLLTALIWVHTGTGPRAPPRAACAIALGVAAIGSLQLIVTRYHYTVDSVVAAFLTFWFVEARKHAWKACWQEQLQPNCATVRDPEQKLFEFERKQF